MHDRWGKPALELVQDLAHVCVSLARGLVGVVVVVVVVVVAVVVVVVVVVVTAAAVVVVRLFARFAV